MKHTVGLYGAAGYTGLELLRILGLHDGVRLGPVVSESLAGRRPAELFPHLRGVREVQCVAPGKADFKGCALVFLALPPGEAMRLAPGLLAHGLRIVDLAADYRLRSPREWREWYGKEHRSPELLDEAVYGLTEWRREEIRQARLVANPGCYSTAVLLALLPLLQADLIEPDSIVVDAKSGLSGAGRRPAEHLLYAEAADSCSAYAASGHRHQPEICQALESIAPGAGAGLTFVPHLVPMVRGIEASIYLRPRAGVDSARARECLAARYADEPFVRLLPPGAHPATSRVRGSNECHLAVHAATGGRLVLLAVLDNLLKGAAGQAVQNMNLLLGLNEGSGLGVAACHP